MRIGFLGPAYPLRGGIAQFIALLGKQLQVEHTVRIFSFKKQYPGILFPGKDQIDKSRKTVEIDIQPVLTPYNPFSWLPAALKIKGWNPDILILKYWIPFFAPAFGVVIILLKLFTKIKVIYLIDNIEFHEKWLFGNLLSGFALNKADELITLSDSVYKDTERLFPRKKIIRGFHPAYNCYDLGNYDKRSARKSLDLSTKKVVLFFGYIKPYKGLDLLLEAFPLILERLPDAHLLIVGEIYGEERIYDDLITRLAPSVTFIKKFVTNEEVELYFKAADVLALPYRQATQSGVLQIAYDMELGAVATPVGGLPEMVLDGLTGKVATSVSKTSFANAVVEFFELDRKKLKENIKKENERYTWESFCRLITK